MDLSLAVHTKQMLIVFPPRLGNRPKELSVHLNSQHNFYHSGSDVVCVGLRSHCLTLIQGGLVPGHVSAD